MAIYFLQIKAAHILAVILSGSLFALRGALMVAGSAHANHPVLRYLSYGIDTLLLTAALMLATILQQFPFVNGWLTAKVLLLVLYIVLGSIALKRGRTRRARVLALVGALCTYGYIVGVARAQHWLGFLHGLGAG